jgi:hypothetical protein
MVMNTNKRPTILFVTLVAAILACNMPSGTSTVVPDVLPEEVNAATSAPVAIDVATALPVVTHIQTPSSPSNPGVLIYDVESSSTAPEKRAPYGDSYDIDRLERPFLQDMTYVSDLDIVRFNVAQDADWYYISMKLIGNNPNNNLGLNYGVEIDVDHNGFGDYLIWAQPPYTNTWDTANVRIYADENHDTAGASAEKSDAPFTADGYETLIFNGGVGDADPDLAWIRTEAGPDATIQFAFKKSWSGTVFMLGVLSDAGLKDPGKLDYVDRFTEAEAGSPVKDKQYYPLGELHSVDNTCQEAFGFKPTGYEPKLCPRPDVQPTRKPGDPPPTPGCPLSDPICAQQGPGHYFDEPSCTCLYLG